MRTVNIQTGKEKYTTRIQARSHELIVDEPEELNGQDKGMMPSELLISSLGACTSITVRMYADRKEWPLDEILVDVNLHDDDTDRSKHSITRKVSFKGALDEKQIQRLTQIANACPVHKLLEKAIEITTEVAYIEK